MLQTRLGLSQRRACRVVGQPRSALREPPAEQTPADPDGPLRAELRAFARAHARWGHRRALVAMREAGFVLNHKRCQRLWREEGLRVRVPVRRKRAGRSTTRSLVAGALDLAFAVRARWLGAATPTEGSPMLPTYSQGFRNADVYLHARLLRPVHEFERVAKPAAPSDFIGDGGGAARGWAAR